MVDYSLDLDFASASSSGSWLRWHAMPSRDGYAPGTWSIKNGDGSEPVDLSQGLVFDWLSSRTGWMEKDGAGAAPRKQWNAKRGAMAPQPGPDYSKAFQAPVACLLNDQPVHALWEAGRLGAWQGYLDLMALLKNANAGSKLPQLPLVACTGHRELVLRNGATLIPKFSVLRFVPRPACLPLQEDAAWDAPARQANGAGAVKPKVPMVAPSATSYGSLDDEIPF
jgi:hypothetical protein